MKDSLIRSLSMLDIETLKQSSRPEWPPVLHNIAMLHGVIRLRGRFARVGWNDPVTMDFSYNEFEVRIGIWAAGCTTFLLIFFYI